MVQVFFHCSSDEGVLVDRRGTAVSNLSEARAHADQVVRSMIMTPSSEDWRTWILHVSDNNGEEIFELPFTSMLGKPH